MRSSDASVESGSSGSILHKAQPSSKTGGHHHHHQHASAESSGRPNTTPITSIRVVSSRGAIGLSASGLGQLVPLGGATATSHDNHSGDFLHEDLDDEDDVMLDDSVNSAASSSPKTTENDNGRIQPHNHSSAQQQHQQQRQRQYSESYDHDQFDEDEATPRGGGVGIVSARGGGGGGHSSTSHPTGGATTPRAKQINNNNQQQQQQPSNNNNKNGAAPSSRKTSTTTSNNNNGGTGGVASSSSSAAVVATAAGSSHSKPNSKGGKATNAAPGGGTSAQHRTTSSNARRPVTAPDPGSPEPTVKKPPTILQQHQQIQQEIVAQKKKEAAATGQIKPGAGNAGGGGGAAAAPRVVAKPTTTTTATSSSTNNNNKVNSSSVPVVVAVNGKRTQPPPSGATISSSGACEQPQQQLRVKVSHKAVIGKGSFGVVYQAMNLDTNHIIACKEICLVNKGANAHSSADQVKQIKQELAMLKQLDHPNIVKCLGEDCDDKFLRIYMEYVTGGSISSILKMFGSLQEKQAAIFTHQMLEGLLYLHAKNICHRDLKGDNLLIDTRGVLKLADFGTAKELASQATSTVAGTAYFMAPEVIQGVGHGVEADVWSVGCCVIEMITGKPPFFHLKNQYAIMMHVAENSKSLDDVQGDGQGTVEVSLDPEPAGTAVIVVSIIASHWFVIAFEHANKRRWWRCDSTRSRLVGHCEYSSSRTTEHERGA
ncbi:protein kinase, putative [Bodo saltans]|uniref:Protein kinase, putative n=1 Tax=Bodo saltans TaxID=75058 RepID=A0A0S4JLG4_BODSA|nr:protein kinase, putative [Bodo saltans]|eukprot:CUG89331.1 protein kinase, putative [Bodo saltans]